MDPAAARTAHPCPKPLPQLVCHQHLLFPKPASCVSILPWACQAAETLGKETRRQGCPSWAQRLVLPPWGCPTASSHHGDRGCLSPQHYREGGVGSQGSKLELAGGRVRNQYPDPARWGSTTACGLGLPPILLLAAEAASLKTGFLRWPRYSRQGPVMSLQLPIIAHPCTAYTPSSPETPMHPPPAPRDRGGINARNPFHPQATPHAYPSLSPTPRSGTEGRGPSSRSREEASEGRGGVRWGCLEPAAH